MAEKIYRHIHSRNKKDLTVCQIKALCLAPFGEEYFRGEILSLNSIGGKSTAKIFFSDFGNIDDVEQSTLVELPVELATVPRQISNCRWDMGMTTELSEVKKKNFFSDDTQALVATDRVYYNFNTYSPKL